LGFEGLNIFAIVLWYKEVEEICTSVQNAIGFALHEKAFDARPDTAGDDESNGTYRS
jgi:hypothetical protein